jgi:hypothetical protein
MDLDQLRAFITTNTGHAPAGTHFAQGTTNQTNNYLQQQARQAAYNQMMADRTSWSRGCGFRRFPCRRKSGGPQRGSGG